MQNLYSSHVQDSQSDNSIALQKKTIKRMRKKRSTQNSQCGFQTDRVAGGGQYACVGFKAAAVENKYVEARTLDLNRAPLMM